jgi:predicted RNA-binding Zn-ribbon protein involved in translation (DUF1610 family)
MVDIPYSSEELETFRESDDHEVITAVEYENGLSAACNCGQGLGVRKNELSIMCPSCGNLAVIEEVTDPEDDSDDPSFMDWG